MAGFNSLNGDTYAEAMYADNMCFDGTARGTLMKTNGQLYIGSSVSPYIQVGSLTSTGGTITIAKGNGTLNVETAALPGWTWSVQSTDFTATYSHGYIITGNVTATIPFFTPMTKAGFAMGFIVVSGSLSIIPPLDGVAAIQIGENNTYISCSNTNLGDSLYLVREGGDSLRTWYSWGTPQGTWLLA